MGLHVYCIMPADLPPDAGLRGVHDAVVAALPLPRLTLWASVHERPPAPDLDAAKAHHAVVAAAMDPQVTPVPVRFGQWFESPDAVAAQLEPDVDRWLGALQHFAGRAEYGVRMLAPDEPSGAAREMHVPDRDSGTAYMAALARRSAALHERRAAVERAAAVLESHVQELVAETRVEVMKDAIGVNVACLVAWNRADEYHTAVRDARAAQSELRFALSGPWPPWSFVP